MPVIAILAALIVYFERRQKFVRRILDEGGGCRHLDEAA
jgi:hypothetical protein